jgi:DeoR/GlpR family transcriptional regulator of sugar metabolism
MLKNARKEKIVNILEKEKECKIDYLLKIFNISLATIHRDLDELEREGRVRKVHGGVILNVSEDIETKNAIRMKTNVELKKKIALKALEFVKNEDLLFLDNSTTCYYFAKVLSESKFEDIIVVTNSYLIPGLFVKNKNIQIISTGGLLSKELNCFVGPNVISNISEFNANKFFFSVAAISIEGGLSDIYRPETDGIKRASFSRSRSRICLVDSTKFNRIGQSKVFLIEDVDKIITDSGCDMELRKKFADIGKDLIIS